MVKTFLSDPRYFSLIVLPAMIFLARICDVTIGTIRIIFVSRGQKKLASFCGFFEVLIWLVAIGQIMQHLDNVWCYLAYAGGFAMGNFIGITIEGKMAMGILVVRVFTQADGSRLITRLKEAGYGVTCLDGHGTTGPVQVIYTVIQRSSLEVVDRIIRDYNPKTFYSIEDVRFVSAGVFPVQHHTFSPFRLSNRKRP